MQQYTTSIDARTASLASHNASQRSSADQTRGSNIYDPQNLSSLWNAESNDIFADREAFVARVPHYQSKVDHMGQNGLGEHGRAAGLLENYCRTLSVYTEVNDEVLSNQSMRRAIRSDISSHGMQLEELCTKAISTSLDANTIPTTGTTADMDARCDSGRKQLMAQGHDALGSFGWLIKDPSPPSIVTEELQKAIQLLQKRQHDTRRSNPRNRIDIRTGDIVSGKIALIKNFLKEIHTGMKVYKLITQSHLDRNVVIDRDAHAKMIELAECLAYYAVKTRDGEYFSCRCGRSRLHIYHDAKYDEALKLWLIPKIDLVRTAAMEAEREFESLYETNLKKPAV